MALPKTKELFSQCPKMFWGRWLSPFTVRHFSDSHSLARSLPGMFVGWENMFCKMKLEWKERTVWVDANIVWGFGTGGLKMNVKGRSGRRETDEDPWRVGGCFRWRNVFLGMCYFQTGVTNSVVGRQENKWGWGGWWGCAYLKEGKEKVGLISD